MKLDKADKRDKKRFKRKHGMRVDGSSVKVIQQAIIKRAVTNANSKEGK